MARKRLGAVASALWSALATVLLLRLPTVAIEGSWLNSFRGYFSFDQMSYAAVAATAATGDLAPVEPFTATGSSFYPSSYYRLIGIASNWTGLSIPAIWTLLGFLVVLGTVLLACLVAYRVSRRWWAPALVGPALWIGPIAAALFDSWYLQLKSHAVLWGPYGAFYTLNGEVIGLCLGASALLLVLLVANRSCAGKWRTPLLLIAAALMIGITANIQTYSFLTSVAIAGAWTAAAGLRRAHGRGPLYATAAILVAVMLLGPPIADRIGALPVFALLLLAAVPGAYVLLRPHIRWAWLPILALGAAAAPQVLLTASGVLSDDAFLTYRQVQSGELGVGIPAFVIGTAPIFAWWLWVRLTVRASALRSLLDALGAALLLLSFNDVWGFTQEPYRLWIDSVAIAALLLPVPTAVALRRTGSLLHSGQRIHKATMAAALAVLILVPLSWWNLGGFRTYVKDAGLIDLGNRKISALAALAETPGLPPGLVTGDSCIDPQVLKVATGLPVAFYNKGLAWPLRKEQIDAVIASVQAGQLDDRALREAGVTMVVTDSACNWDMGSVRGAMKLADQPYAEGTLSLWRLS